MKESSAKGRYTVLSTHNELCSSPEKDSVQGYSIFFEILENSEVYALPCCLNRRHFHLIYKGRKNTCEDYDIDIGQRYGSASLPNAVSTAGPTSPWCSRTSA